MDKNKDPLIRGEVAIVFHGIVTNPLASIAASRDQRKRAVIYTPMALPLLHLMRQ